MSRRQGGWRSVDARRQHADRIGSPRRGHRGHAGQGRGSGLHGSTGLALEGTDGIIHVLRSLLAEADLIMAVDGYPTVKDLRADGAIRRIASNL